MPSWPSLVKQFRFHWRQRGMPPLGSAGVGTEQRRLHCPQRGAADTDENGGCFGPCLPKWKLKERTSNGRNQSIWRLFCFTWQSTWGNVSPARMTVQESCSAWWERPSVLQLKPTLGLLGVCKSMGCSENFVKLGHGPEWCRADACASNVTRSSWHCARVQNQTPWTPWPSINKNRPVC